MKQHAPECRFSCHWLEMLIAEEHAHAHDTADQCMLCCKACKTTGGADSLLPPPCNVAPTNANIGLLSAQEPLNSTAVCYCCRGCSVTGELIAEHTLMLRVLQCTCLSGSAVAEPCHPSHCALSPISHPDTLQNCGSVHAMFAYGMALVHRTQFGVMMPIL